MRLYLVRHGESEANKLHLHNTPETKLTGDGVLQAKTLAKRLGDIKIDFIYASTHTRTMQTAEEISKSLGIPIEKWDEITEVKTPSVNWGKPEHDEKAKEIERSVDENYIKGQRHSDEETFIEIKARAQKVLNHLIKNHKDQSVLMVSHTSFIKMLILVAVVGPKLSPETYLSFRHHSRIYNSGISLMDYEERGWVLLAMNDVSHL